MLLFYIVQVITHANNIEEYNEENNSVRATPTRLEASYLTIDAFLMCMAMIQLFWAWSDYQSFELVLLQTNSCIFGLLIGSLVLSSMSEELHHSATSQFLYAANVILGICIIAIDLLDLRPIGLNKTFDLLKRVKEHAKGLQDGAMSDHSAGSDMSSLSRESPIKGSPYRGLHNETAIGGGDGDVELNRAEAGGVAGNGHRFRRQAKPKPLTPYRDDGKSQGKANPHFAWGLESDDVTDGFRVRLDRIVGIAHGTSSEDDGVEAAAVDSSSSNNRKTSPRTDGAEQSSSIHESLAKGHLPTDVAWESFTYIEHRIDSSSCHIYTAMWMEPQSRTNMPVIIKLIKADRVSSPIAVSEFEAEAAVLSCTEHSNIVKMLGSGHKPRRFVILELLDGGSLSHSLGLRPDSLNRTRTRKFTYLETLALARDLASSLDYLHNRCHRSFKVVHRDLKPDNIGWTSDGTIKLFDFGLCCVVRPDDTHTLDGYRMTGNTGTLRYMAPEVALNRPYHSSVDVYSFSIVVWQVLTGAVPFREMGKRRYFDRVVHNGHRPPLSRAWPKRFRDLLQRGWHEDKNQRPDFEEVVRELDLLILEEERLDRTGFRKLQAVFGQLYNTAKQWLVSIRPFFVLLFFCLAIGSVVSISGDKKFQAAGLGIISSAGLYLTLVSTLRYHVRGDGHVRKSSSGVSSREDILSLSIGLEAGKGSSFENQGQRGKEDGMFALNPLGDEDDNERKPLYGL
jgi:serine/threonine protein kinase